MIESALSPSLAMAGSSSMALFASTTCSARSFSLNRRNVVLKLIAELLKPFHEKAKCACLDELQRPFVDQPLDAHIERIDRVCLARPQRTLTFRSGSAGAPLKSFHPVRHELADLLRAVVNSLRILERRQFAAEILELFHGAAVVRVKSVEQLIERLAAAGLLTLGLFDPDDVLDEKVDALLNCRILRLQALLLLVTGVSSASSSLHGSVLGLAALARSRADFP